MTQIYFTPINRVLTPHIVKFSKTSPQRQIRPLPTSASKEIVMMMMTK